MKDRYIRKLQLNIACEPVGACSSKALTPHFQFDFTFGFLAHFRKIQNFSAIVGYSFNEFVKDVALALLNARFPSDLDYIRSKTVSAVH